MPTTSPASERGDGQADAAGQRIASLRERGAQRLDPVRFSYIEALYRRAAAHEGLVKLALDDRLVRALAAYSAQFERSASETEHAVPEAAMHRGQLGELVDYIDRMADNHTGDATAQPSSGGALADLKTLRHFRKTWARLSVDQQLSRSRQKLPENAGPLNSHQLVLRSLELMQEISPAYLKRFMSHVESLLWLDQASFGGLPAQGKTVLRQNEKKRKTGRSEAG